MVALANMLEHFYNTNCKTLIFSGNLRVLDCIAAYIRSKGRKFARIDGQVSVDQRQAIVNQFQTQSQTLLPFMLMSTEVGGLGFNLTAASKVIIFDVNWNPTKDQQSQDRAYRIGQTEKVSVYRLVAKGRLTHSHAYSLLLTHMLTHSYSLTYSLTLTHSYSLLLTHSYSLLLTLTHSLLLTHSYSLTLTYSLTYSLTHSLLLTHSYSLLLTRYN